MHKKLQNNLEMEIADTLFIIPARGGSKGVPRKNILQLAGKPLICYTIDAARNVTPDDQICISTDDNEIINVVEDYGLKVPFVRPAKLATDNAGSREVILHAINYFENKLNIAYSKICLLQPTSPFRTARHIQEAFMLWEDGLDMVVSVKESKSNPYYNLFEEDENDYLRKLEVGNFTRRQDAPKVWEFNGAIYIIKVDALKENTLNQFTRIIKYEMDEFSSHDIDSFYDWVVAKELVKKKLL